MLNAAELTAMRATHTAALPEVAAISRPTRSSDGAGGYTTAWATVATVACSLAQPSGGELEIANQAQQPLAWVITLPYGTDVAVADRIVISETTYEVFAVLGAHSFSTALRVLATTR
jgi:SPP1 family predicted phage head-tail adaptor